MKKTTKYRQERDSLGIVSVPKDAYFGAFTVRARENFQISGIMSPKVFCEAIGMVKKSAAMVNGELGLLEKSHVKAIVQAADEFIAGKFDDEYTLDVFQAGAGTPFNMNINEILANRANEILGQEKGGYSPLHPNNHINMAQSTNDVIPTAMRVATLMYLPHLLEELASLQEAFRNKARTYIHTLKLGRTHLQDAVPITLGQEFRSYVHTLEKTYADIQASGEELQELGIGGTAAGTGLNTDPKYSEKMCKTLSKLTGVPYTKGKDLLEKANNMDAFARVSSSLKRLAIDLTRIANDLKLLSSGPTGGMNEITLPDVEPGSSIMPGKINPSIPEAVEMVSYQIMGNDQTITLAAQRGQLELNVMTPVIMFNLLWSIELLTNTLYMFHHFCVDGMSANTDKIKKTLEKSRCSAAALNPYLGYQITAEIVKEAQKKKKTIEDIIRHYELVSAEDLEKILAVTRTTQPAEIDLRIVHKIKKSQAYAKFKAKNRV